MTLSPADELRAAAARLRALLDQIGTDPWESTGPGDHGPVVARVGGDVVAARPLAVARRIGGQP